MTNDDKSLSHSKWNCKYHKVFALKCRRRVIYGKLKREIGKILRNLCEQKGVEITEEEAYPYAYHLYTKTDVDFLWKGA